MLPCCFFDFAGKYRRQHSQKTQYREYLDFVQEVGRTCGFHVQEDCLRIPSTKRVRGRGLLHSGSQGTVAAPEPVFLRAGQWGRIGHPVLCRHGCQARAAVVGSLVVALDGRFSA